MENVLSFLTSLEDSEVETILTFLKEYLRSRNHHTNKKTISKTFMNKLILKRLEETKPIYETPEEFESRKREAKWYVQCELV